MSILFESINVGPMKLKNRFIRSPCYMKGCDKDGFPKKWLLDYYKEMADGEMGLIIPGYLNPLQSGKAGDGQGTIRSEEHAESWRKTVEHIHQKGSKIIFQVGDAGNQTSFEITGERPRGPSVWHPGTREMTVMEISEVIEAYCAAAKRMENVGLDGIQTHAAHGYLISQFLSPVTNRRTDSYGGSPKNRRKILKEIISSIRRETSKNFAIATKINVHDCVPGGIEPPECAETVANLDVDFVEISCGLGNWPATIRTKMTPLKEYPLKEGYLMDWAKIVRERNPNKIISVVGGFRKVISMENAVKSGVADLISLGRPSIADPKVVQHIHEGDKKVKCVSCGKCMGPDRVSCKIFQ